MDVITALLTGRWRLGLLFIAAILMAAAFLPQLGRPAADARTGPATAGITAAGTEPTKPNSQAAATGQPTTPQPAAVPTVENVRPLSGPIAPKLSAKGPAPVRKAGSPDPMPSTDRFIVMDGASGAILFEENSREPVAPASLTKIMTAILGIEHGSLDDYPKLDVNASDFSDSTVMGLESWFHVTLEDLLYGLMLPSGNDAAVAIARYVAGNEGTFVRLMNEKATWLGLQTTHFANPHGLDASDHYSSPYDMAVMARYGLQYPEFQRLAAAKHYDIRRSNIAYSIDNLNPMLSAYPGADGVKIGYTDNAGRSIVASATRNGHQVIVAFMKSTAGLAPDASHLLDWAFGYHTWPN